MDFIDEPKPVREGEELDVASIEKYLASAVPGLSGKLEIAQFPSGHSNLTYLIKVGDREMVLRRPPFGRKAKTAHDMGREYRILKALKPHYPYCPEPLAYTEDESIMGCPFYVMERMRGIILRKELPAGFGASPEDIRRIYDRVLDVFVELHAIDYAQAGLEEFGRPEGYVRRQVEGWSRRYREARTPDVPDFENIMTWLAEKMPPDHPRHSIVHGDYRIDNVVLDPADPMKVIGVLDWEMATIGDPLMDLGNSLAYWVEKSDPPNSHLMRLMPTHVEGAPTRMELVARYEEKSGIAIPNFDYYRCFGLFRLAVIVQQIYYRFYHGQTKDQRFALFVHGVKILEEAAAGVIEGSAL
ncbi:MAG TPA: phosphotransferase family protein [Spirochaetes bacterium]|nr:phosphotransferase family protein [Spirochaetota bacterium]